MIFKFWGKCGILGVFLQILKTSPEVGKKSLAKHITRKHNKESSAMSAKTVQRTDSKKAYHKNKSSSLKDKLRNKEVNNDKVKIETVVVIPEIKYIVEEDIMIKTERDIENNTADLA